MSHKNSYYEITCICGKLYTSEFKTSTCPGCSRTSIISTEDLNTDKQQEKSKIIPLPLNSL